MKFVLGLALCLTMLAGNAFAGQDSSTTHVPLSPNPAVAAKLIAFADSKLKSISANIKPSVHSKEIVQENGEYIARYLSINTENLTTRVKQSAASGRYIGIIKYHEMVYEARGKTPSEAMSGQFDIVKARRVTEIVRYTKGSWM
ncbi:hypothetical protein [Oleidesulfovibrio sp.]|uniref:hypothetical protein n=1 Tax=Oleidesulfovibrio sp. TaxID=2909707 RepID=UPI003A85E50A